MSTNRITQNNHGNRIDIDLANELFNHFCTHAATFKSILRVFRLLCETLRIKPTNFPLFYPKLKSRLHSWKANAIWAKLDKRSNHRCYGKGKIAAGQRVLVIGAGPCGLRTAIEAQLLGAKVIVIEKRDRFSRNNVLHLWPYNITDLRGIGAKKFYGKFCAGAIDHISIRQLQCILLKVCLLLGVEIFENCGFEELIEPKDIETGWKAKISPPNHPVSQFEFDVLIGADGKRNTLHGFKRKEFRGKLAIAITVNFIHRHSELESMVEEISGVAFIFNQKFFNDLNDAKGIDLENIVYYKDETHYFVMTAKKQSLLQKGVIMVNEADTAKLLAPENINQEALFQFAKEAADYATNYKLPNLEFAVNHYGKPDVAMFDFTSMFQAENSCRITERHGHRLFTALVGDSLLEPFWPTGTGCARGFFGGFDACWALKALCIGKSSPLEILAERESVYRVLAQTTPENTVKDYVSYNLDPASRYTNLNMKLVLPFQVLHLYDTDDPTALEEMQKESTSPERLMMKRRSMKEATHVSHDNLLSWLQKQLESYPDITVNNMTTSFQDGLAFCAIIHRYRPDLIPDFASLNKEDAVANNELAFEILEHDLGVPPVMAGAELAASDKPDKLTMISYLSSIYEVFRRDVPSVVPIPETRISDDDLLDSAYKFNHRAKHNSASNKKILSIGQLVAGDALARKTKKRRSGDEQDKDDKENVLRSGTKKRLAKMMERSDNFASKKRTAAINVSSIKKEERFKVIEEQFRGGPKRRPEAVTKYRENKRPKELRRAIGKIDKEDWNLKNIEEKLKLNKEKPNNNNNTNNNSSVVKKDKVPKWSKAAFQDKFNIMKDKLENNSEKGESEKKKKFNDIDFTLARLHKKLREGSTLETGQRGSNKVSALASELFSKAKKDKNKVEEPIPTRNTAFVLPTKSGSETCHFCGKRVYVVERMSAEGKFFHRSCFRCDYCNILLRLGSYVYKRDGHLGGKFFCIPHYTETYMEKYRYRHKADEIKDAEARRRERLEHLTTNDWNKSSSLTPSHKERLLSSLDPELRGTTPERVEFEASTDQQSEEEHPSIMDEDEWTDRNFGNSRLENQCEDTSDDSVSDLESDTESEDDDDDDDEEGDYEDAKDRPLTADEARQLQQEWIKRYDPDCEDSYCKGKKNSKSSLESSEVDEDYDDESVNYEDGEYESIDSSEDDDDSSDSESSEILQQRLKASRPHPRKSPQSGSSTEVGSEDLSSDSDDEDDDDEEVGEYSDDLLNSEFNGSESNTECEFTDSEGRPNPFHKELDDNLSKRPVLPTSSSASKICVVKPDNVSQIIPLHNNPSAAESSITRYQYKTPNISDRLKKQQQVDSVLNSSNVSTRRALNLKKTWASGNNTNNWSSSSTKKKVDSSEIDNRLKSLMDRLSSQQKLLKPAANAEPSKEMKHVLQSSMLIGNTLNSSGSSMRSPPIMASGSFRMPNIGMISSGPPIYRSVSSEMTENDKSAISTENSLRVESKKEDAISKSTGSLASLVSHPNPENEEVKDIEEDPTTKSGTTDSEQNQNSGKEVEEKEEEEVKEVEKQQQQCEINNQNSSFTSCNNDSSSSEESQSAHIEFGEEESLEPVINNNLKGVLLEVASENGGGDSSKDEVFESCNEDEDVVAVEAVNDNISVIETKEKEQKEEEKEQPPTPPPPLPPPPPTRVITLTEDEITKIYKERNPLEKIAKINSYRQKQSSVIHDMILANRNPTKPRKLSNSSRLSVVSPLPPPPPPPPPPVVSPPEAEANNILSNLDNMDFPLIDDEDGCSIPNSPARKPSQQQEPTTATPTILPATPITDPEKFGIPPSHKNSSKSMPTTPTRGTIKDTPPSSNELFSDGDSSSIMSPEKKNISNKKTFMQSLSGLFNKSRMSSPETFSRISTKLTSPTMSSSSSSCVASPSGFKFPKLGLVNKPVAPKAEMDEDKLSPTESLNLQTSHPSTPPIPLSRKINIEQARKSDLDSFSDGCESPPPSTSSLNSLKKVKGRNHSHGGIPPEIVEKLLRRGGGKTAKYARVAQLKRVRKAQELQRQLEELDVQRKDLENRGIRAEQELRGESQDNANEDELMQEWFKLLAEKNALIRKEQELLVMAKQLELEDRSAKLEIELRECLLLDSRGEESVVREGEVLKELLEISEQREKLQAMLEKDKMRYQKEDKDIEAQMIAKGLRVTPIRKFSA